MSFDPADPGATLRWLKEHPKEAREAARLMSGHVLQEVVTEPEYAPLAYGYRLDDQQRRDLIAALDDAVDTWAGGPDPDRPVESPEPSRVDRWRELRRLLAVGP